MVMKDITGQKFGRLTAIEPTQKRSSNGFVFWLCKCDCGKEAIVRNDRLRRGNTRSCGCLAREILLENCKKITEKRREAASKMGKARRKHFGCMYCGSDKHFAKGLCRSCYNKVKRGTF